MNVLKRITKTAVNLCHIYVTLHDTENKRCAESLTRWWPGTESNCRHKDFQKQYQKGVTNINKHLSCTPPLKLRHITSHLVQLRHIYVTLFRQGYTPKIIIICVLYVPPTQRWEQNLDYEKHSLHNHFLFLVFIFSTG